MTLIVLGLIALMMAWFQYRAELRAWSPNSGPCPSRISSLMAVDPVMGLIALVVVIRRL